MLLSLSDFPFPWQYFFPGAEEPPDFIIYSGIVLGIFGLIVAVGLWLLKRWSFWATLIVAALNFLLGVPGVVEVSTPGLRAAIIAGEILAVLVIVLVVLPASRRALAAPVA